jgi:hypothetical protein
VQKQKLEKLIASFLLMDPEEQEVVYNLVNARAVKAANRRNKLQLVVSNPPPTSRLAAGGLL